MASQMVSKCTRTSEDSHEADHEFLRSVKPDSVKTNLFRSIVSYSN